MNWEKVICYDCNLINDYFITVKLGLNICRCNGCGKYLGNKPNTEKEERERIENLNKDEPLWIMPFGQYKGQEISKIDDPEYFEWLIKESKIKGCLLLALENRLAELIINEK